jgi:hypothetical protein
MRAHLWHIMVVNWDILYAFAFLFFFNPSNLWKKDLFSS